MTALANSFSNETAAIAALIAEGFKDNGRGYFTKKSRTGGNLMEGPRDCIAIVEIVHNRVDPEWNAPDFFTLRFL